MILLLIAIYGAIRHPILTVGGWLDSVRHKGDDGMACHHDE